MFGSSIRVNDYVTDGYRVGRVVEIDRSLYLRDTKDAYVVFGTSADWLPLESLRRVKNVAAKTANAIPAA